MSSAVLANLGQLHIVTGRILYTTGVPALTSNDGSATVADTGTGNPTVTFGDAFLTAPQVVASYFKITGEAATTQAVTVEQATTTIAEFKIHSVIDSGAGTTDLALFDPADGDGIMFIAVGMRNK
jgi:predicted RNA methylase